MLDCQRCHHIYCSSYTALFLCIICKYLRAAREIISVLTVLPSWNKVFIIISYWNPIYQNYLKMHSLFEIALQHDFIYGTESIFTKWLFVGWNFFLYIYFFVFFLFGFYGPSRIFHSFWAESIERWGKKGRSPRKTTWPPVSRTWTVSQ